MCNVPLCCDVKKCVMGVDSMKIRKKTNEPRDTVLTIRLSKSEQTELKKRAAAVGLSVGAFLLSLALSEKLGEVIGNALGEAVFGSIDKNQEDTP